MSHFKTPMRPLVCAVALLAVAGCDNFDIDMRDGGPGTAEAARNASANRPTPDSRGIISYPNYQVAVARRGDTLQSLARRIGVDVGELSRYNGIQPGDTLRDGEIIALPGRVAEPAGGPLTPRPGVDIASVAGNAIENASSGRTSSNRTLDRGQSGVEPVRHQVQRGETAFTIARLYDVSVRSLADWNGLGTDFAVREGQYLLIPVAVPDAKPAQVQTTALETTSPGQGSPTPTPPSAAQPLPEEKTVAAAKPVESTAAPDLGGNTASASSNARMSYPVKGDIIREYSKGKNDGIDIAAPAGTPVRAARSGTVAAITKDTNGVPIIVVKHDQNLLTVYSNVDKVRVSKGDSISRGGQLASIRTDGSAALHFEVREGFESVDPLPYLQ
ncbi:peptidoglycan DD-metalloendopeptidase family protein [Roseovarius sp. SK2]|uniref:peptidoglycan DD-metalloendopeptidase family protein n=1 Tax=Roseovarius TaxID=74030 RepID=UPI00237B5DEA|nr:peptidoglycan DD-metalloendopeptidase family protein [Roseovarius sp. SK2]MDD9724187.1 peptidoglycan DD-metalloendopeptidase family protein [Roseovarius sp. SK2]